MHAYDTDYLFFVTVAITMDSMTLIEHVGRGCCHRYNIVMLAILRDHLDESIEVCIDYSKMQATAN